MGATDDIGLHAIRQRCHFRDIHTTVLHQLGLDQDELSYLHQGRKERLTLLHGKVIERESSHGSRSNSRATQKDFPVVGVRSAG